MFREFPSGAVPRRLVLLDLRPQMPEELGPAEHAKGYVISQSDVDSAAYHHLAAMFVAQLTSEGVFREEGASTSLAAHDYGGEHGALFVCYVGAEPVGMVAIHQLSGNTYEGKRLFVVRGHRSTGVSVALCNAAVAWARDRGGDRILIDTSSRLRPAVRLLQQLGFRPSEPYNDNPDVDLWLELPVTPSG